MSACSYYCFLLLFSFSSSSPSFWLFRTYKQFPRLLLPNSWKIGADCDRMRQGGRAKFSFFQMCLASTHFLGFPFPLSTMNLSYSYTPYRSKRKESKKKERTKEKLNRICKKESPYNAMGSSYCTQCLVTPNFWAPFFLQHFCCNLVSRGRNLLL